MKKYIMLLGLCLTMETYAMNNPSYVYKSSEEETKRLNRQSDLIRESALEHLQKAGLAAGKKVVDLGCGSGAMTTYLAEQVGPSGHVYALDIDEKQLEVTRAALLEKNLGNVSFIRCNIEDENCEALAEILESVDLVYMRFVMMHLKRPDIAAKNIFKILKKGGSLASQESILSSTHCEPIDSAEIRQDYAQSIELARKLGTDKNIGGRLTELYREAGFTEETYYKVTHRIEMNKAAFVMLRSYAEQKPLLLEHGLSTEAEIESHIAELKRLAEVNDRSLVFDQGHIVARK